jgi:hypothetical protein
MIPLAAIRKPAGGQARANASWMLQPSPQHLAWISRKPHARGAKNTIQLFFQLIRLDRFGSDAAGAPPQRALPARRI